MLCILVDYQLEVKISYHDPIEKLIDFDSFNAIDLQNAAKRYLGNESAPEISQNLSRGGPQTFTPIKNIHLDTFDIHALIFMGDYGPAAGTVPRCCLLRTLAEVSLV